MFHLLIVLLLVLSLTAFAQNRELKCKASYYTDVILESTVSLASGEKNKLFGELAGLQLLVSDMGHNIIELQVVNLYEPSRSYANAKFLDVTSFVELSIWKRDYLLEARCSL